MDDARREKDASAVAASLLPLTGPRAASVLRAGRFAAAALLGAWALAYASSADVRWAAALCAAVPALLLAVGDRLPIVALAAPFAALVVLAQFAGYFGSDDPYIVMLAWASYGVGRHARLERQPWAAAAALLLISLNVVGGDARMPGDIVFPALFTAVPWLLGLLVQRAMRRADQATLHADRLQSERDRELEEAAEAERLRIARDLHDVAAHCLTVVSLQAQVARRRLEAGQPVDAATMRQIESSAAEALSALRSVVGALRPVGDDAVNAPVPGLEALQTLVEQSNAAGQAVTLSQTGDARQLSPAADLAVYRVVQESLTNALRHGGPGTTTIDLTWNRDMVEVSVRSPLGTTVSASPQPGHGLVGMRERVSLLGGRLQTGPQGSCWRVLALLPLMDAGD